METALAITLLSLANGAGRVSARVTNSASKRVVRVNINIKSGGVAPTLDTLYKFYLHRQDDETVSHQDDGVGEVDAALTTEPFLSDPIGSIKVTNDADTNFPTSFVFYDPGPYWSLSIWNASGQAISATEIDHWIRFSYLG